MSCRHVVRLGLRNRWGRRSACDAVVSGWLLGLLFAGLPVVLGQTPDSEERVAATVDNVRLYVGEVESIVERAAGKTELDGPARELLSAEALDQLVRQQMVLSELERQNEACTQQEFELALTRFTEELKRQGQTLDDLCRARHIPRAALERGMRWRISWNAYLARTITEEHLQRYFESHRRDYDGTRLRVAQILLTVPANVSDDRPVRKQADDIRGKIDGRTLTFSEAARQYSQAPSAADGGDIGWISRHEPMPEPFSVAAFQLQPGEVSPPVRSPLGFHLIQCLEIESGTRTWQDVRDELAAAAQIDRFNHIVDAARKKSRVEFAVGQRHFRPGTKELERPAPLDKSKEAAGK